MLTYPKITAGYGALFAILLAFLSLWVINGRLGRSVLHGDGGDETMNRRIRAHGNFTEYVPFILLLVALLEMRGVRPIVPHAILAPLLIARLAHPVGMLAPLNSPAQFLCRGAGTVVTLLALLAAAGLLLAGLAWG